MSRELLVLGLLRQQKMHGYQLHDFIEQNLSSCTDMKKQTLYALLDKLAKKEWVEVSEEQEGNRPIRKVYAITSSGEAEFQRLLRANLSQHGETVFVDDIGMVFIDALPSNEAIEFLVSRRELIVEKLAGIQPVVDMHQGGARLVVEHQAYHLESEIRWLDKVIADLESQ